MDSKRDSWVKHYEDVEFDIPFPRHSAGSSIGLQQERERMLPQLPYNAHTHASTSGTPLDFDTSPPSAERALSPVRRVKMAHVRSSSTGTPSSSQESSIPPSDSALMVASPDPPTSRSPRSGSFKSFTSSPLNPTTTAHVSSPFGRPGSRGSTYISRLASEECRALSVPAQEGGSLGARGSMILYKMLDLENALVPPTLPVNRGSMYSSSGDSFVSLSSDSKYPSGLPHGFIAYAFDPSDDDEVEEDPVHDPELKLISVGGTSVSWRGVINFTALALLISGFFSLFILYPVLSFNQNNDRNFLITRNSRINSTGQAIPVSFDQRSQVILSSVQLEHIDPDTPLSSRTWKGTAAEYELVFSDEFELDGRTFYRDEDHFWEASDEDAHDPEQVFTRDGHLVLQADRMRSGGATDADSEHVLGLLTSRSSFCVADGGFVEVKMRIRGGDWIRAYWTGGNGDVWSSTASYPSRSGADLSRTSSRSDWALSLTLGWGAYPDSDLSLSSAMEIDYVRMYQRRTSRFRSCNPRSASPIDVSLHPSSIIPPS